VVFYVLIKKVTAVVADAASAKAISELVDRAVNEEGHLDFFFANAGVTMLPKFRQGGIQDQLQGGARRLIDVPEEEFTEVMRINALRYVAE
jgi:NAD(P)-dependent dehydrogenase (short-subunit alcohol dehydrogenase family)